MALLLNASFVLDVSYSRWEPYHFQPYWADFQGYKWTELSVYQRCSNSPINSKGAKTQRRMDDQLWKNVWVRELIPFFFWSRRPFSAHFFKLRNHFGIVHAREPSLSGNRQPWAWPWGSEHQSLRFQLDPSLSDHARDTGSLVGRKHGS
jgi:hypothetical protein